MLERAPTTAIAETAATVAYAVPVDVETCGVLDLTKVGPARYATDPRTRVRCLSYAIDDGPVRTWVPGKELVPTDLVAVALDPRVPFIAHNAGFRSCRLAAHPHATFRSAGAPT